jgi:hypothetical protein
MPIRTILARSLLMIVCSPALFAQQKADQPKPAQQKPQASPTQEFPVTMRQNVVAGKTPVGTKIQARLTIATLVAGKVVPEGAIFSGFVVESMAKSASSPSRLSIRVDSVQWKKESASITAYLTSWYYPFRMTANDDMANQPPAGIHGDVGMQRGTGPRPPTPASQPFPTSTQQGPDIPSAPTSNISDHRVEMKDVESERASDGAMSISSTRFNLKLDKSTTYVLATGELTFSR